MAEENWSIWLRSLSVSKIDERLTLLKDSIKLYQQEIVMLTIIRKGIQRQYEFKAIAEKRAMQAIDEAITEANEGTPPLRIQTNTEGGMTG